MVAQSARDENPASALKIYRLPGGWPVVLGIDIPLAFNDFHRPAVE